ncbi:hypothetical protein Tco_1503559 [Tanacetum coccineum]
MLVLTREAVFDVFVCFGVMGKNGDVAPLLHDGSTVPRALDGKWAEHSVFTPPREKPPTTEVEPPVFTPRWFLKKPQTSPDEEGETRKQPSEPKHSTIVQTRGH